VHGGEWTLAHRLDRDTSGVLLLAHGAEALRLAHAAWGASVTKRYVALVRGEPAGEEGTVDAPIVENRTERPDRLRRGLAAALGSTRAGLLLAGRPVPGLPPIPRAGTSAVHPAGRPSRTSWRVLERRGGTTLLELSPHEGRMHQIRVHLLHAGMPLLGDRLYDQGRAASPSGPAPFLRAVFLRWASPPGPPGIGEWRWEVPVFPGGPALG
jgi:23S rRNA-/tRNA-specific pseudouridylate synthase